MVKRMFCAVLVVALSGCCVATNEDYLDEVHKHLVENVRPNYAEALQEARTPDGKPLYLEVYKDTQLGVVDQMIFGIDRVMEREQAVLEPAPWAPATPAGGDE